MDQQNAVEPQEPAPAIAGRVVLSIPADREQVVLVRSVAGHIAARLGMSMAELADLRLAVDEACGLFLLAPGFGQAGESVECRFEQGPDTLTVTVSAPARASIEPDVDDIGWLMLSALVDELTWKWEHDVARLTLVKLLGARDS